MEEQARAKEEEARTASAPLNFGTCPLCDKYKHHLELMQVAGTKEVRGFSDEEGNHGVK